MALKRSYLNRGTSQLKRSALERSDKPLRRGKGLKRGPGPKRRFKRESAAERKVRLEWTAAVFARSGGRSILNPSTRADDPHHVLPKSMLKRDKRADLLWVVELGVGVTRTEHMGHHYSPDPRARIPYESLPPDTIARARAEGYGDYLDRTYPKREEP